MKRWLIAGIVVASWFAATSVSSAVDTSTHYSALSSVSCPTTQFCVAVGFYVDSNQATNPLVEKWDGTAWSIVPAASPATSVGSTPGLRAVSCVSATSCVAIGSNIGGGGGIFAEHWDGTSWQLESFPLGNDNLDGVSCASASFCIALGQSFVKDTEQTAAWRWNGTQWSRSPSPALRDGYFYSISCPTAGSCTAVGRHITTAGNRISSNTPLLVHWNGKRWSVVHLTVPSSAYLNGISCTQPGYCTATGSIGDLARFHNQPQPLVLTHTPTSGWTRVILDLPADVRNATFGAVSCVSRRVCTATARYNDSLDGAAATNSVAVRGPTGGFHLARRVVSATLNDISCRPMVCTAVGYSPPYYQMQNLAPGPGNTAAIERGHGVKLQDSRPAAPPPYQPAG